jgi:hypothetical protein
VAHQAHPQNPVRNDPKEDCRVGERCVSAWAIWIIVTISATITVLCLYGLWAIWPDGTTGSITIVLFTHRFTITDEEQLFALVALSGGLGGLVHLLRSLVRYVGNRQLRWSWVAHYALLPLIGAAGSTIFYIVARAGLISTSASGSPTDIVNPFGFAAVAVLVGLFTEQAMEMLRHVSETVFSPTPPLKDTLDPGTGNDNQ